MFDASFFVDGDILPPTKNKPKEEGQLDLEFYIRFLNKLEGWKSKCKNLHWSAPKKNIHEYLDDFLKILSSYQDSLAEEIQGILGHMAPNEIVSLPSDALTAMDFIIDVKKETLEFYEALPADPIYAGIRSECETFIHNIFKYKYLFELADSVKGFY